MGVGVTGEIGCHITRDHEDFVAAIEEILCDLIVDFTLTCLGREFMGDDTNFHDFIELMNLELSDSLTRDVDRCEVYVSFSRNRSLIA
jgi:hypothetical protein